MPTMAETLLLRVHTAIIETGKNLVAPMEDGPEEAATPKGGNTADGALEGSVEASQVADAGKKEKDRDAETVQAEALHGDNDKGAGKDAIGETAAPATPMKTPDEKQGKGKSKAQPKRGNEKETEKTSNKRQRK
eukprot:s3207_g9.t1